MTQTPMTPARHAAPNRPAGAPATLPQRAADFERVGRWLVGVGMSTMLAAAVLAVALPGSARAQANAGKTIYDSGCSACHGTGVLGAPKFGDAAQWGPRAKAGIDALVRSAIAGTAKGMPPKGGRADLSDAQIRATVE
ncbi:MAG: hypothetical protein RLZZ584_4332, partial [Pseudomonadota bacterium]